MTRLLVWHWGRTGAGPRYAAQLAAALGGLPGVAVDLSLPDNADILADAAPPAVALPVRTYRGRAGFLWRGVTAPLRVPGLARRLRARRPDLAVCAMPAMLDLLMAAALRRLGVPIAVVVHDAAPHPGERVPLQHRLQRRLLRRADAVVALSAHVADALTAQAPLPARLVRSHLPPLDYGGAVAAPAEGPLRLLCFGRLLPYKGLDLLAEAWDALRPADATLVVAGQGPESPVLDRLRRLRGVEVRNAWIPDHALAPLVAACDVVVLPYREASQSGVAAVALALGRRVLATDVGGLREQLAGSPLATLCEPRAAALAGALSGILAAGRPKRVLTVDDPVLQWRKVAEDLLSSLETFLIRAPARKMRTVDSDTGIWYRF